MPRTEIIGREEILGGEETMGAGLAARALRGTSGVAKKLVTLPITLTEKVFSATTGPIAHAFVGRDEILGAIERSDVGSFVGDEERLLREAGSAEREACARTTSGYNTHLAYVRGDDPNDEVPKFARDRYFYEQYVQSTIDGFKLDKERARAGDELSRTRVRNTLNNLPRWISMHRRSTDPESFADNFFYWVYKLAAPKVPEFKAIFDRHDKPNQTSSSGDAVSTSLTPDEQDKVRKISSARQAADAGDASASRKMALLCKEIPTLVAQARAGNERALRSLLVLRAAGVSLKSSGA